MTLDPQALTAAAEAEARYDGYDDLLSFSKTTRERYIDRAGAAVTAYLETAFPPRTVKLTPEDERLLEKALLASTDVLYPVLPADAASTRIAELEAALEPFARLAESYFYRYETRPGEWRESHENDPDDRAVYGINRVEITTGDFRRARKALENRSSGLADANSKSPIQAREE